jgi:hypothetical protein
LPIGEIFDSYLHNKEIYSYPQCTLLHLLLPQFALRLLAALPCLAGLLHANLLIFPPAPEADFEAAEVRRFYEHQINIQAGIAEAHAK